MSTTKYPAGAERHLEQLHQTLLDLSAYVIEVGDELSPVVVERFLLDMLVDVGEIRAVR